MENAPGSTVNYLQFDDYTFNAAKQNEELVTGQAPTVARESLFRPTYGHIY